MTAHLRIGLQHGALRDGEVRAQARQLVLRQAQLHGRHLLLLAQEAHHLLQLAACVHTRQILALGSNFTNATC